MLMFSAPSREHAMLLDTLCQHHKGFPRPTLLLLSAWCCCGSTHANQHTAETQTPTVVVVSGALPCRAGWLWGGSGQLRGMGSPCCRRNLPHAGLVGPAPVWKMLGTEGLEHLCWEGVISQTQEMPPAHTWCETNPSHLVALLGIIKRANLCFAAEDCAAR